MHLSVFYARAQTRVPLCQLHTPQARTPHASVSVRARSRVRGQVRDYATIFASKNIDMHYQSVTFGTFGSFGTGTWSVITKACDPTTHPKARDDDNPWNAPGPKRDFILSLGFALQRANSRMLRDSDRRRRNARACGKYSSGTRPLSPLTSPDDDY